MGKEWYNPQAELKEWWNYAEVRFTKKQILWILKHTDLLREGKWPPDPVTTGYFDVPIGKRRLKAEASFIKPSVIISEVDYRLKKTGIYGKLLVAEIQAESLYLSEEAKSALAYISGWRRKRQDFKTWMRQRRYESKKKVISGLGKHSINTIKM